MRVWLVQPGESFPFVQSARKLRTGHVASELASRGHDVVWWGSAFDHFRHDWIARQNERIAIEPRVEAVCLAALGYRKNVSLARVLDHRRLSWSFRSLAKAFPRPDVVVASTPPYDLAYQAARYASTHRLPLVVDIRDPWPDIFVDRVPSALRPVAQTLLSGEFAMMRRLCAAATNLVAVSDSFLQRGLRYAQRSRRDGDRVYYLGAPRQPATGERSERVDAIRSRCAGRFVITFVGTFGTYHDPIDLVRVARRLGEDSPMFVIAGAGDRQDELVRAAEGLDRVIFPGWLDEAEIRELLSFSHAGACSTTEHIDLFPNKAFLYLSAGLPLLNAFDGDLRDWTTQRGIGISYEPGNVDQLAAAVEALSAHDVRKQMSTRVRVAFSDFFDQANITRAYVDHIETLGRSA